MAAPITTKILSAAAEIAVHVDTLVRALLSRFEQGQFDLPDFRDLSLDPGRQLSGTRRGQDGKRLRQAAGPNSMARLNSSSRASIFFRKSSMRATWAGLSDTRFGAPKRAGVYRLGRDYNSPDSRFSRQQISSLSGLRFEKPPLRHRKLAQDLVGMPYQAKLSLIRDRLRAKVPAKAIESPRATTMRASTFGGSLRFPTQTAEVLRLFRSPSHARSTGPRY